MSTDLHPNPNIAALMRLNARLHKRVDVLYQAIGAMCVILAFNACKR